MAPYRKIFPAERLQKTFFSSLFGSAARNPIHVPVDMSFGLHDASGRVTLPGFYDDASEVPAEIKAQRQGPGFDGEEFLKKIGLSIPAGEVDRSVLEQIRSCPAFEVNDITGGYGGPGFKAVIRRKLRQRCHFVWSAMRTRRKWWRRFRILSWRTCRPAARLSSSRRAPVLPCVSSMITLIWPGRARHLGLSSRLIRHL